MHRFLELALVFIAGCLSLPFFCAAWVVLRLCLGAPSVFRQTRSGLGGQPFEVLKLRTMSDSRDSDGILLHDRQRQTRISALIRRLRLDELPQLLLIVQGKMALVGPRPLLPETIAAAGDAGRRRGMVRPGLTGWAQVSGNTKLSDPEKMALDLWYIDHRSTALDLQIIAETLLVAIRGEDRRPDRLARAGATPGEPLYERPEVSAS